jgi:hypothetical protein
MTALTHRPARAPKIDPLEQMERDDRSDWEFLRLVVCVAVATLALAVASTLPA